MKMALILLVLIAAFVLPALSQCPPVQLPFTDNFDSPSLDSCWSWIREDASYWSLTERPGWMRIQTTGSLYWPGGDAANILLMTIPDTNFAIEARVEAEGIGAEPRLIVYTDDDNFVDLNDRYMYQDFRSHSEANGYPSYVDYPASINPVRLKIEKIGIRYSAFICGDGSQWAQVATWDRQLTSNGTLRIGLLGYTASLGVAADFDYFRFEPLPGTPVCGDISGVWDTTGSPYYVNCDVTVPAGQTLEIRPGVQVLFTGHYKFNVYGNLQAIGTEQDSIVFTRAFETEESKWMGIRFHDATSSASELAYCLIRDSYADTTQLTGGGGIYCDSASPQFMNCSIVNCAAGTGGGAYLTNNSNSRFAYCLFGENIAFGSGGGLRCDFGSSPILEHCVVKANSAIDGGGLFTRNETVLTVSHCTIVENSATLHGGGIYNRSGTTNTSFLNTIVWGNSNPQVFLGNGNINIGYSDIQGSYSGIGNIDINPLFVNAAQGDFRLQANSPCIDAGDPNSPRDADSTIADMGAFPYLYRSVVIPMALDFGLCDIGADSTQIVMLINQAGVAIPIMEINHANSAFAVDTTGLNGAVAPHSTYMLNVTFRADAIGSYADTLLICFSQPDSVYRIPLHGHGDILLPAVDSLVMERGAGNAMQLNWAPVMHTISGRPFTPPYYIIYGATSPDGPWVPIDASPTNAYTHTQFVLPMQYFYRVTAATE